MRATTLRMDPSRHFPPSPTLCFDVGVDKDVNSFESAGMQPKTEERSPNTVQTNEVQNSEKETRNFFF